MLTSWLLSHIAIDENNCTVIIQSEVIKHVIPLLDYGNNDLVEKALWLINNLLLSEKRGDILGKYSMISLLSKLLQSSSPSIIATCARMLEALMRKDSNLD